MLALLLATATLNPVPPAPTPCRTVNTPRGQMCITQNILRVYGGAIRTQYENDAKAICHGRGGNQLLPSGQKEWLCIRVTKLS